MAGEMGVGVSFSTPVRWTMAEKGISPSVIRSIWRARRIGRWLVETHSWID